MDTSRFAGLFGGGGRDTAGRIPVESGSRLSAPVPAVCGERVCDAVFVYPEGGRPTAWALLDPASGALVRYSQCAVDDLVDRALCPIGARLALNRPDSADPERARAHLGELLQAMRDFVFVHALSSLQEEARREYRAQFERLTPVEQYPFYHAMSPAFFSWLGMEPPAQPAPETPAVPAQETGPAPDALLIYQTLQQLVGLFQEKISRDEQKERLFDEMHAELQQHKNGLLDALTRPMEEDIIKLIDDIGKTMEHHRGRPFSPDNYRRLFALFEGVRTDLTDLLYRHGVEPFTQGGEEVVIGRQKVLATVKTDKPEQDRKIAERLSDGWEKNGQVIRPERVSVYLLEQGEKQGVDGGK